MIQCLITGAGGFLGTHLTKFLLDKGCTVTAVHRRFKGQHLLEGAQHLECDVLDRDSLQGLIGRIRPDQIYHLAGQDLVHPSWSDPEGTFRVNVFGTLNLLEAVRETGVPALVEMICSSSEYAVSRDGSAIAEDHLLEPASPYGISKLAQDHFSLLYHRAYELKILRLRPFFIVGPGKEPDVCSDFARGIAAIERQEKNSLAVGNLEAVRDFIDVRDALAAFWTIAEKGTVGEVYNVCTGRGVSIQNLLNQMIQESPAKIRVTRDPGRERPLDEPVKVGDNRKLRSLGWKPQIPLEETLLAILEFWREKARIGQT